MLSIVLLWLTVSLPFVYEARLLLTERTETSGKDQSNPLAGATEEKTPSNPTITITEEYLHQGACDLSLTGLQKNCAYLHAHEATYIAFHPELHAPPPNA